MTELRLRPAQQKLLTLLRERHPDIVGYADLASTVTLTDAWRNYHNVLKVHIHGLRQKLEGTGYHIETVWGKGYRLVIDTHEDRNGSE